MKLGYLNYVDYVSRYEPSPSILALGFCVLSNMRVRQLARDYMQQLADHGKTMVALAARDRLSMIYVTMCNGSHIRTLHLDVGSRVNIATSATGRAFLAGVSENEREYFFQHFKRVYGGEWPTLRSRILESIAEVEERGFCLVDGEWQRDVRAVGVPIVSPDRSIVMSMNCAGPKFHLSSDVLENDLGPRLAHLSRGVAQMLGSG
jgi:DNA-binding IclR family transcriptional regulator